MKKTVFFFLMTVVLVFSLFPSTISNIVEIRGQIIIIDKGRLDGVQVGLKGIIKAVYKDPSGEYDVNIGLFSVKKVNEKTSELTVDSLGSGFKLEDARYVIFEASLKTTGDTSVPDTLPQKPVKVSVEDLLDQGERYLAAEKYALAIDSFQKVIQIDSDNLIAKEKIAEAQRKLDDADKVAKFKEYLKKSDSYYQKKDVKYAFLYLVEAYKSNPDATDEVKKRLVVMNKEYPQDFSRVVTEKEQEIGDMRSLIQDVQANEPVEEKVVPTEPPVTPKEELPASEPYLQSIRSKAQSLEKNEQGYWVAKLLDDLMMIYIPEGEFTLGSPEGDGDADEHPAHKVFLSGFWVSKYEIPFDLYDRFCRETKAELALDEGWGRGKQPVINVSWEDAKKFCAWLSRKIGLTFRLPTEAEWERVANDYYPWGSDSPGKNYCNFGKIFGQTTPVGSFPAGASKYGVMDLAGNVWEWIHDWYDPNYYQISTSRNPMGPDQGNERVVRGGSWDDGDHIVRSANRSSENPTSKLNKIGFRVVITGK